MPRKTDSNNPRDWLDLAAADLEGIEVLAQREVAYSLCRSKLAEVLEKILKAELIRLGWFLENTHDLEKLSGELNSRKSDLMMQVYPLCEVFAEVYFSDRYPGFDMEEPDWPELKIYVQQVGDVLRIVQSRV